MKYKNIIISFSLLVFGVGIYITSSVKNSRSTPTETKVFLKETTPQVMTFSTSYTLCGHKVKYTASADKYYRTKEEAEVDNIDFTVDSFSEEKISLSKAENKYCNKHFYAILNDNMIYIYSRYSGKAEYGFPVVASRISKEELEVLKVGIEFDSKESMLSFVEDYTS